MPKPQVDAGAMPHNLSILQKTKFKDDNWDAPYKESDPGLQTSKRLKKVAGVNTTQSRVFDALKNNDVVTPEWAWENLKISRFYLCNYVSKIKASGTTVHTYKSRVGNKYILEYSLKPFENPINDKK